MKNLDNLTKSIITTEIEERKLLHKRLQKLALKLTKPFCYTCYITCTSGICESCDSDDLMRELDGVGVDYGTDWIIDSILEQHLTQVDIEAEFKDYFLLNNEEVIKIGNSFFNSIDIYKTLDITSWENELNDWRISQTADGTFFTNDDGENNYLVSDIESLLNTNNL